MKILLIKPPFNNLDSQIVQNYPPLGILYLLSVLRENGHSVDFIDFFNQHNIKKIADIISRGKADIYGISMLSGNRFEALAVADIIKRYHNEARIVLGGVHAAAMYRDILSNDRFLDGIFVSEAEYSLLRYVENPNRRHEIPGFAYYDGKQIHISAPEYVDTIDDIPMPFLNQKLINQYHNTFAQKVLNTSFNFHNHINYHMLTGRGCSYTCNFCAKLGMNVPIRLHSASRIIEEMARAKYFLPNANILFHDENFTIKSKRTVELCEQLSKQGVRFRWNIRTRPENLDYGMLKEMRRLGLESIFFGVESGSEKVLRLMNKNISVEKIRNAFFVTAKAGIKRHCNIIIGYPGETKEDFKKTIKLLREIKPDTISFSGPRIYPGTALAKQSYREGIISKDYWIQKKYTSKVPVYYKNKGKLLYASFMAARCKIHLKTTLPGKLFFCVRCIFSFIVRRLIRMGIAVRNFSYRRCFSSAGHF